MQRYRSFNTIEAVQYQGDPIPEVTCDATSPDLVTSQKALFDHGCGSDSRHKLPHVHTKAVGGLSILKPGDWIFPVPAGPFGVADDKTFRAHWEVAPEAALAPVEHEALVPVSHMPEGELPLPPSADAPALGPPPPADDLPPVDTPSDPPPSADHAGDAQGGDQHTQGNDQYHE